MNKQQRDRLAWYKEQLRLSQEKTDEDWRMIQDMILFPFRFLWVIICTIVCAVLLGLQTLFRFLVRQ